MDFFGGIIDFNRMGFLTRKGIEAAFKSPLQKHRFKETGPGAYELRDWNEIRNWAKKLAKKSREYHNKKLLPNHFKITMDT